MFLAWASTIDELWKFSLLPLESRGPLISPIPRPSALQGVKSCLLLLFENFPWYPVGTQMVPDNITRKITDSSVLKNRNAHLIEYSFSEMLVGFLCYAKYTTRWQWRLSHRCLVLWMMWPHYTHPNLWALLANLPSIGVICTFVASQFLDQQSKRYWIFRI